MAGDVDRLDEIVRWMRKNRVVYARVGDLEVRVDPAWDSVLDPGEEKTPPKTREQTLREIRDAAEALRFAHVRR